MSTVDNAHAKYGASTAERWLNCPGSVALSLRAPPPAESPYAAEGTRAHACFEALLKAPDEPAVVATLVRLHKEHPFEMVRHAEWAADVVRRDGGYGPHVLSERKVRLPVQGADDVFGTLDAAVVDELGTLRVYDFKYGAGVAVEVVENPQMVFYALGLAHLHGYLFTDVELVILQPRADHPDGPDRRWRLPVEKLRSYLSLFAAGRADCEAQLASGQETYATGKWCRFCPAKVICPAVGEEAFRRAEAVFQPLPPGTVPAVLPTALPPAEALKDLGRALKACDQLEDWVAAVRSYAFDRLMAGDQIPGFKLVPKRAQRRWRETARVAAIEEFGDLAFERVLLSPAQVEKQLKAKDFVAEHAVSESSGLTIAPESDKRLAANPSPFSVLPPEAKP